VDNTIGNLRLAKCVAHIFCQSQMPSVSRSLQKRAAFVDCIVDNTKPMQTVEAFCAKYGVDIVRAQHVSRTAARLFDETHPMHGLQPRSRELLIAGAQMLEIGQTAGEPNPFTAGRDRVIAAPLMGISPSERAVLACVVAFQRDNVRTKAEPLFMALPPVAQAETRWLAALARIAAALDDSRTQTTRIHAAERSDDAGLTLQVRGPHSHKDAASALQAAGLWHDLLGVLRVQGRLDAASISMDDSLALAAQKAARFRVDWAGGEAVWALQSEQLTPRRVSRLRVAVRRMRNDIRLFGAGLRGKIAKPIDTGLHDLSPLLRNARLHDALIENVGEYERRSDEDAGAGLKPLMAHWQTCRERAIEKLAAHGASDDHDEWRDALAGWLAMEDEDRFSRHLEFGEPSHVRHMAHAALHAHLRDVRAFDTLPEQPPAEQLHALRVAVKRLRYACEVLPLDEARALLPHCVAAQDAWGAVNDAHEAAGRALAFVAQQRGDARAGMKGIVTYAEAQQNMIEARLRGWRVCLQPFL
jgi:CHAD domain-containing protein